MLKVRVCIGQPVVGFACVYLGETFELYTLNIILYHSLYMARA